MLLLLCHLLFILVQSDSRVPRITNGQPVTEPTPWLARIATLKENQNGTVALAGTCGATFIKPKVLLTAAHCVSPIASDSCETGVRWKFKMVLIYANVRVLRTPLDVVSSSDDVLVHPEYQFPANDIAMIQLRNCHHRNSN